VIDAPAEPAEPVALQEVARLALTALEEIRPQNMGRLVYPAITGLREALGIDAAQPPPPPAEQQGAEPVAEVCSGWALHWAGNEPLATLLARHPNVRIGTKLYAAQPPQPVQPPTVKDSLTVAPAEPAEPVAHVGDSAFEGWFQGYRPGLRVLKQMLRDAYAAGMSDPTAAQPPQPVQPRSDGMPASTDERKLRRMYAVRVNMPNLYMDDGEASGSEHGISIDFMREPVADIAAKVLALEVARYECRKPRDSGCWCARCDMEHNVTRTRMSVCDKCGDKRCPRAEDHRNECRETPNAGAKAPT
jgi:hypothetical protein